MKKWMMTGVLTAVAVATMACGTVSNAAQEGSTAQATSGETKKEKTKKDSSGQEVVRILPDDLEWQDNPEIDGIENAAGIGNLEEKGLYAGFGRMSEGAVFPAHSHTDDRLTTVISGTMYYGVGEEFDEDNMTAYPAGSVIFTPAGTPHVMWVQEGQAVIQESGDGPSSAEFVE
ncbi:MAG: cupin domain-containing protein [Rubrobacteraceae bacterium]